MSVEQSRVSTVHVPCYACLSARPLPRPHTCVLPSSLSGGSSSGELSLEPELEPFLFNPDLHVIDPDDLEDLGTIGDGNFGTVHKMRNKKMNRVDAVTVLHVM